MLSLHPVNQPSNCFMSFVQHADLQSLRRTSLFTHKILLAFKSRCTTPLRCAVYRMRTSLLTCSGDRFGPAPAIVNVNFVQ